MGLDGISINQLRVTPELNSAELNSTFNVNQNDAKIVDGLSNGQKVDPDKESEHDNSQFNFNENDEHEDQEEVEEITKYDLSDTKKYSLKLDSSLNKILIIDKSTNNIIQSIDADILSKLVCYAPNSCGSIVSKKL